MMVTMRSLHLALLALLLAMPVITCGGRATVSPGGSGSGGTSTGSPAASCPDEVPEAGTSCPGELSCHYERCDTLGEPDLQAVCEGGVWLVAVAMECPVDCAGLDVCECFDEPDCDIVSEDCLCICDYFCPGHDPCDCGCGGGAYLGCVAK